MSTPDTTPGPRFAALRDPQRRGRLVIGGLSLLISAGYTWEAFQMPMGNGTTPGAGSWPSIVGIAWIVISAVVIVEAVGSSQVGGSSEMPRGKELRDVVLFFAFTVGLVVLMPIIGAYLSATVYVLALTRFVSRMAWWKSALTAMIMGFGITWLFINLLSVRLPEGPLGGIL